MRGARGSAVLATLLSIANCSDGAFETPSAAALRVNTDSLAYTRDTVTGSWRIQLRFHNAGMVPIRMSGVCGSPHSVSLERREQGTWIQVAGFPCPAIYALADTVLPSGDDYVTRAPFALDEPGLHRYRVLYGFERGDRNSRTALSNAFMIR